MENNNYTNLPKEKFVLVNENKKLHDKELVTKPVGFFKDAMYRFAKNKGSIVAAIVIGVLVLFAIIAPIISPYTVAYNDINYAYCLPKLFNSEKIDFLDGAKTVDANFVTFVEDYSKGVETGHNAIKRQEYTYNEKTGKYHYRYDTYQGVGMIFMGSISRSDYYAIQRYQDKSGVQIIYPITDVDKRPENEKNVKNANIWYETYNDPNSSNDIPTNYSYDEKGNLVLNNIYKEYSVPQLNSTNNFDNGIKAKVENKNGGYAIKLIVKTGASYEGEKIANDTFIGYLATAYEEDANGIATKLVQTIDEASAFTFDSANHLFKINVTGHENPADDGDYYLAMPGRQGSAATFYNISKLGMVDDVTVDVYDDPSLPADKRTVIGQKTIHYPNNIPFSMYDGETMVDALSIDKEYSFASNRYDTTNIHYFLNSFMNDSYSVKTSGAIKISLEEAVGGYKVKINAKGAVGYLNVAVNGNNHSLTKEANVDNATIWSFDGLTSRLKINLTGHTDASLDKEYTLAFDYNAGLAILSDGTNFSETLIPMTVVTEDFDKINDTYTNATTISATAQYRLYAQYVKVNNNYYYIDGNFKGDNYFSKMRIEGEGNHLYDYAIQKDGDNFEIRINYYEYYRYYHSQILKDRITEPYFIFGSTKTGQDIFTCLASGARFSFILAIVVASVNLVVGAIYGAIEGYYGGKVDMIMERIVEILSAVPFMIVITLLKYRLGDKLSPALLLFIAFFLTGWIGMSGVVRMQFYRFKNQEYVLAARTLGAKDPRIMFKHIFPNALGTIVTSCVLVIPGMIFSETSLSYLGIINLNSGDMTSVGTLLADAQGYIDTYPHMILYPAIFISLLMLSFNLFGNGLRDAFNPSLRGTED